MSDEMPMELWAAPCGEEGGRVVYPTRALALGRCIQCVAQNTECPELKLVTKQAPVRYVREDNAYPVYREALYALLHAIPASVYLEYHGSDEALEEIGEESCREHFGIEEKEAP